MPTSSELLKQVKPEPSKDNKLFTSSEKKESSFWQNLSKPFPEMVARTVGDIGGRLFKGWQSAGQNIVKSIEGGAEQMQKGGVVNIAKGALQSGLGAAGGVAGAVFSPFVETAKEFIPGEGLGSKIGQGAATGAALAGPVGAVAGGVFGATSPLLQKGQEALANTQFFKENPDLLQDANNALSIGMLLLAEKGSKKLTGKGQTDILNTPISEVPGRIAENLAETAKVPLWGANKLYKAITYKSPEKVEKIINDYYQRGVKPSTAGKGTLSQAEKYRDKSVEAVDIITKNKKNLTIVDEYGESTGKLPKTLNEFNQAIDQTKKNIFDKYDAMAKTAGEKGAKIDLNPIADELDKIAGDSIVRDLSPNTANYAAQQAKILRARGSYDSTTAQKGIELLNDKLSSFYKNPTAQETGPLTVDAMITNKLRAGLDSAIEQISEPGYQELKNQYGALKAIEKDVLKRSLVDARKNAKLAIDYSDILSGAEVVKGIVTGGPGVITGGKIKGISAYYKYLNNPNTAIKKMFEVSDKYSIFPQITGQKSEMLTPTQLEPTGKLPYNNTIPQNSIESQFEFNGKIYAPEYPDKPMLSGTKPDLEILNALLNKKGQGAVDNFMESIGWLNKRLFKGK